MQEGLQDGSATWGSFFNSSVYPDHLIQHLCSPAFTRAGRKLRWTLKAALSASGTVWTQKPPGVLEELSGWIHGGSFRREY